jgi:ABC-type branched-subunit amino acid transport system substrate-binding protein
MKVIISLILLASLSFSQIVFGQNPAQTESKYKSALNDYKQGRYAVAMEKFFPMTSINQKTPYSPYAQYYYALSAYQLKRFRESRQMLLQLQSRYPGWNKINDVSYLLGAVAFETGQINEGLEQLNKIKESSFARDVQALKYRYLSPISDLGKLRELQKQNSSDRDIALVFLHRIYSTPSASQSDRQVAEQLERQFKFSKKEKAIAEDTPKRSTPKEDKQWTKGYLDVAVLLPFRLEEFSTTKHRSNQFAYDYYLGLTMAKEQLLSEGINLNLWAYDVGTDAGVMQNIVANQNFRSSDMVIGPLYPGTFDVTADFVSHSGSIMLNPLSTDIALLKAGSNIYLGHPSINFQTQKAAQWMRTLSSGLSAVVFYGNTPKDSAMAVSYATEWKNKGGKVVSLAKIQPEREWMESNIPNYDISKPGHIALFSSNGSAGVNLMEVLDSRKLLTLPVVATSTSFNAQFRTGKYGSRLYLINPDYVDRDKESIRQFQKTYWNKTNTFPSVYSYQGYDQLLFFGRMLSKYQDKLSNGLQSRKYEEEYLLAGFDYTKANENQITPVLKFNGSKWIPVDR